MQTSIKFRNILQLVAVSAPPVLMALAGLLLMTRRPKPIGKARETASAPASATKPPTG